MDRQELDREITRLLRDEKKYHKRRSERKEPPWDKWLSDKLPDGLEEKLESAFVKAFALIFEKGTPLIEKTWDLPGLAQRYLLDDYALRRRGEVRDLRRFTRRAERAGLLHTAVSGAAGAGLGAVGVGLPDVALFTGLLLRNVYEIAMHCGYDYEGEREQAFLLRVIAGAFQGEGDWEETDRALNRFIAAGSYPVPKSVAELTDGAARALSRALLLSKFVQGVPVVGVLGGAADAVYMNRVSEYAALKYRRRFLADRKRDMQKEADIR